MIPTGETRKIIQFWILSCEDFRITDPQFKCPLKKQCEYYQKQMFNKTLTNCPSADGCRKHK